MRSSRSPFLQSMPVGMVRASAGQLMVRNVVFWTSLLTLTGLWWMMQTGYLTGTMVGTWLFWAHDHLFLTAKGWLVTRFFPYSLIWCGLAVTGAVVFLVSFLSGKTPVRHPHLALARQLIRLPVLRPLLLQLCRHGLKLGLRPALLTEVALHHHRMRLLALADGGCDEAAVADFKSLTDFVLDLMFCLPPVDGEEMRRICRRGLVLFRASRAVLRFYPESNWKDDEAILTRFQRLTQPLIAHAESQVQPPNPFDMIMLVEDTAAVLVLERPVLLGKLPTPETLQGCKRRLAALLDRRRRGLDELREDLESGALRHRFNPVRFAGNLPAAADVFEQTGPLAMGLAVDTAQVLDEPDLALSYLETVVALQFAMDLTAPDAVDPEPQLMQRLRGLIAGTPDLVTNRICGLLAASRTESYRSELADWKIALDGPLQPEDLANGDAGAARLQHAGGCGDDGG